MKWYETDGEQDLRGGLEEGKLGNFYHTSGVVAGRDSREKHRLSGSSLLIPIPSIPSIPSILTCDNSNAGAHCTLQRDCSTLVNHILQLDVGASQP